MAASGPCELLAWDTDFWGVPIARVLQPTMGSDERARIDDWAREHGVACLYFLARGDDPSTIRVAEDGGFRLVDVRVELVRRAKGMKGPPLRLAEPQDVEALRSIARVAHTDSRFYADPNFTDERCGDLYALWIERACAGWADAVLVAHEDGLPVGYMSCRLTGPGGRGSLDLLGVDESVRGRGIGASLVTASVAWLRGRGLRDVGLFTQGRNVGSQRLFQRLGFRTTSLGLWFHKWYDR
jgi:ribosomal protein S18 acetylase RimI-like enzyme